MPVTYPVLARAEGKIDQSIINPFMMPEGLKFSLILLNGAVVAQARLEAASSANGRAGADEAALQAKQADIDAKLPA